MLALPIAAGAWAAEEPLVVHADRFGTSAPSRHTVASPGERRRGLVHRPVDTFAPRDDDHRWMGSIAMNQNGDIALGYSLSGPRTFPSVAVTGRTSTYW